MSWQPRLFGVEAAGKATATIENVSVRIYPFCVRSGVCFMIANFCWLNRVKLFFFYSFFLLLFHSVFILIFHKGHNFLTLLLPRHSINKLRKLRWYNQSFESYLTKWLFLFFFFFNRDKENNKQYVATATNMYEQTIMMAVKMIMMLNLINWNWKIIIYVC